MPNIKKLLFKIIFSLLFASTAIAETNKFLDQDIKIKQQHQLDPQDNIKDSNILAKEYFNIGRSFFKLGQYKEVIKNYDLAIKYKPNYAESYNNKGMALNDLGQYKEAIIKKPLKILILLLNMSLILQKLIIIKECLIEN